MQSGEQDSGSSRGKKSLARSSWRHPYVTGDWKVAERELSLSGSFATVMGSWPKFEGLTCHMRPCGLHLCGHTLRHIVNRVCTRVLSMSQHISVYTALRMSDLSLKKLFFIDAYAYAYAQPFGAH